MLIAGPKFVAEASGRRARDDAKQHRMSLRTAAAESGISQHAPQSGRGDRPTVAVSVPTRRPPRVSAEATAARACRVQDRTSSPRRRRWR